MSNVKNIFVYADNAATMEYVCSAAAKYGEEAVLVFSGAKEAAKGAAKAYIIPEGSVAQYIPAVMKVLEEVNPDLVITDATNNGKLIAGLAAAKLKAAVLSDIASLDAAEGFTASRMVYGGAAFQTQKVLSEKTVICLNPGMIEETELTACTDVTELTADAGVKFMGKDVKVSKDVNLGAAKKLVAVGRGAVKSLDAANTFAAAIGAEVGCTRPIAEEEHLMPKETYIGVSGVMCKPEVYFGLGISGQVQHMVGVNSANTMIVINKDKNAPIFSQCDYGLVAELDAVLPALTELVK